MKPKGYRRRSCSEMDLLKVLGDFGPTPPSLTSKAIDQCLAAELPLVVRTWSTVAPLTMRDVNHRSTPPPPPLQCLAEVVFTLYRINIVASPKL